LEKFADDYEACGPKMREQLRHLFCGKLPEDFRDAARARRR